MTIESSGTFRRIARGERSAHKPYFPAQLRRGPLEDHAEAPREQHRHYQGDDRHSDFVQRAFAEMLSNSDQARTQGNVDEVERVGNRSEPV